MPRLKSLKRPLSTSDEDDDHGSEDAGDAEQQEAEIMALQVSQIFFLLKT